MAQPHAFIEALQAFAAAVAAKFSQHVGGEEEERLRQPFENFMEAAGLALGLPQKLVCSGEVHTGEGRPDYGVNLDKLLTGYAELKAPGKGVIESRMKGADKAQFRRFMAIPNLLYCDGNDWALYRDGKLAEIVRLKGDIATQGKAAVSIESAEKLEALLRKYLAWRPFIPTNRRGQVDLEAFARQLAPLCRMLRNDVTDALLVEDSPLRDLAADWRQLLFPDASDERFADAYAQTVTFALLLARSDGADPLTRESAEKGLAAEHGLLSRALKVLTDDAAYMQIKASVDLLLRYIGEVPRGIFEHVTETQGRGRATGAHDPWLYFYEDFLAVYDAKLRKDAGAYYTPVEVVHAQVRLIDDLLRNQLGKPQGFASPDVITLDPAVGTGTYLLGVIEHALGRVEKEQGAGAVPGHATTLAANLHGFEIMVGPYAVSELRVSRMLKDRGATLPKEGTHVYLTDTLESPHAKPTQLPLYLKPISEQHERALKVKASTPVIVCLGNPPYDRHSAESRLGGWVRYGDPLRAGEAPILADFIEPARAAGHGVHIKNLYNLYVYFWRWALWKVFEHDTTKGPGVVSFISASSYIDGDAFSGMREHMRRHCDEIWVLDIGGEGRGTRQSDNVFAIQTPVAIAVAVRKGKAALNTPAKVHYAVIDGSRAEKLKQLDSIQRMADVVWQDCPSEWQASFRPAGKGGYFESPLFTDLMPWQQSGVKAGRTWVIAEADDVLNQRWKALLSAAPPNRRELFKDSPTGRKIHESANQLPPANEELKAILGLPKDAPAPAALRFAYRSFDRQFILADARVLDRPGPALWRVLGSYQLFLTSLFSHPLGAGCPLTASALLPDLHHFRGSYGDKGVIPLYRTADASEPNILPGLLDLLTAEYGHSGTGALAGGIQKDTGQGPVPPNPVTPEDFLAYVYGLLAQDSFTARFHKELETRELRVPLTRDAALFEQARAAGARLLWLHTYGERYSPSSSGADGSVRHSDAGTAARATEEKRIPPGKARNTKSVPGEPEDYPEKFSHDGSTLHVGAGEFAPVSSAVFNFEVSGLKVVQSWLGYRMKAGKGKKSSPLDDIRPERWTAQFTTELLELLWVLEATLDSYPKQAAILDKVLAGPLFRADELPPVPDEMRKPPKQAKAGALFGDGEDED